MEVSSDRQITDLFQEIWDAESNDEDKTPPGTSETAGSAHAQCKFGQKHWLPKYPFEGSLGKSSIT